MASNCPLAEQQLLCPVCMDLFNDPVTIPCGHSFCRTCVMGYWNSFRYSYHICPMCREVLECHTVSINFVLRDIVESFKKTSTDVPESAAHQTPVPGESVTCDECLGESRPEAVTFCLVCLMSYCGEHQESHGTRFPAHRLVESVTNREDRICRSHRKRLELYCKKDKMLLCQVCVSVSHWEAGHDVTDISPAYVDEKDEQIAVMGQLKDLLVMKKKASVWFSSAVRRKKHLLEGRIWEAESLHGPMEQLRTLMDEMESTLTLRSQALDNELAALTTTIHQLEELLSLNDPCYFLQNLSSIDMAFEVTTQDFPALLAKLSTAFLKELGKIIKAFSFLTNRAAIKLVASSVTLDQTTAHPALIFCGKAKNCIRVATHKRNDIYVGRHHRFTRQPCVLGTHPLLSDAYWEVTVDNFHDGTRQGASSWFVGVATEAAMEEPPRDTFLYPSDNLWVLTCKEGQLCVHGKLLQSGAMRQTQSVGVCYSRLERSVSFYEPTRRAHLHTVSNVRPRARVFPVFCPDLGANGFSGSMTVTSPKL